jgi:hypothetical protein
MWVPTPNAKFGPPKRKRTIGERQKPPKEGLVDIADSAKPSVQASIPLPSSPQPLIIPESQIVAKPLSESQIVALREEEESQSQSQSMSNQPGGPVEDPTTSDPLQPTVDSNGATEVSKGNPLGSLEGLMGRPSVDIQLTNPNVNNGHVSGPNSQGVHLQSNVAKNSMQGEGVSEPPKGSSLLPAAPRISLVNLNPSASAISSPKSPQVEKPASKPGPPQIGNPGTSTIEQHSPPKSGPRRSGNGTLAERRAFEARVRLDELRRAGATFGNLAKGYTTSNASQSSKQAPPHVVLKKYKDVMESPSQSQITNLGNSGNETLGSVSPGQNRRADFLDEPEVVDMVINKSGQDANVGSLPQKDNVVAANVLVLSSEDEVPPTASNSTQSQSHDALPHASLGSQLAAALDLLHKRSEEISELRAQVNMLRIRSTDGEMHKQAGNGALHGRKRADYLATGSQTDQDDEAYTAWNSERTLWAEEKLALQGEAETLRGEKARTLADVDFFREQYQRASAFASTTRSENEELSARAALAESQAVNGVAMVRATFEARVAKLEAEVQKYKALSELLTKQARLTGDNVRYQAARVPELERTYDKLKERFWEIEDELEETKDELRAEQKANTKLRRRVASLEPKEPAADVGQSTERGLVLRSEGKDDEDYRPSRRSPSSSPAGGSDDDGFPPQHHSPHDEDGPAPADGEIEQLASIGLGESAQSSNDDMVYLCQWRPSEPAEHCDVVVSSKQELHEHVLSHHLACHRTSPRPEGR